LFPVILARALLSVPRDQILRSPGWPAVGSITGSRTICVVHSKVQIPTTPDPVNGNKNTHKTSVSSRRPSAGLPAVVAGIGGVARGGGLALVAGIGEAAAAAPLSAVARGPLQQSPALEKITVGLGGAPRSIHRRRRRQPHSICSIDGDHSLLLPKHHAVRPTQQRRPTKEATPVAQRSNTSRPR
jgi:hypothetical protein